MFKSFVIPGYTCPSIDPNIKELDDLRSKIYQLNKNADDVISEVMDNLDQTLRGQNVDLREAAEGYARELEKAEAIIEERDEEIESLQSTIESLHSVIADLQNQLQNVTDVVESVAA